MDVPAKKRLRQGEFLEKVLLEIPVPSAGEMAQAHLVERHLGIDSRLEDELMALRWWYLSHLLFGQLAHRAQVPTEQALRIFASFIELRDMIIGDQPYDFSMRCDFYERALQQDLSDEAGAFHVYDTFEKFVGRPHDMLREFYFASMMGVATRLTKAVERFEIVE
jgi:hypothetical protein